MSVGVRRLVFDVLAAAVFVGAALWWDKRNRESGPVERLIWSGIGANRFVSFTTTQAQYLTVVWKTNVTADRGLVYESVVVTNRF